MALLDADALFADGGALSQADPRFESRPQQVMMAAAVAAALRDGKGLVVEAGTGVGKSLAYLLPAALWALETGRRVVISTHTRALQEQILEKELPMAARVLREHGQILKYAMLQGADNYLCTRKLSRLPQEGVAAELSKWAQTADSGHRSSLPCLVPQGLWARLARDPDICQINGRFWNTCLYRKDRERAERSHILVVNHALLLSGARLPSFDALIIDEAHTFEEAASSHFGINLPAGRFNRICEDVAELAKSLDLPQVGETAALCAEECQAFLKAIAASHGRIEADTEPGGRLLDHELIPEAPASLVVLDGRLAGMEDEEARTLQTRLSALRLDLKTLLEDKALETARWVQWSPFGIELRASPLEVGERLAQGLLSRGIPVVMTSATLSAGKGLKQFKAALGFEGAAELILDSPYDYESQAALLLLDDLPAPADDDAYAAVIAGVCKEIVDRVPGGVFLLFSSWKALRRVHGLLRRTIQGRPLWIQGTSGNEALLNDFIAAGNAVLLGVDTFWQGVDVPGDALSCVVLAKLPFPNFGSPVEEARRRFYDSLEKGYFEHHSLPRAVMKFRQGFGRLIRSGTDRGAVVVLDPRITKKPYGKKFIRALPRCRRLASMEELGSFFKQKEMS